MKLTPIPLLFIFSMVLIDVAYSLDCCQKLQIPDKCHFLCGTRQESFWSWTRWTCTHQHGAKIANCKVTSSIDYVKAFGNRFTNTIKDSFNKLSASVKEKLSDASKFTTATVEELKSVSQDVLSSIATVSEMSSKQFKGLVSRFTSFTAQNLKNLLERVNIDIIVQNIQDLGNQIWDIAQAKIIASTAYKKYGKDISKWTSQQLSSLGNLIAGIPSSDLAKVAAGAFDKSLTSLCKAKLKIYQKVSLITPATKSFGKISTWTSSQVKQICSLVEAMTPEQLLEIGAKEISDAVDGLKSLSFDDAQLDVLLKKTKEHLGEVSSWTLLQLQNIGKMMKGLSAEDLAKIDKDKIKSMLTDFGKIQWDTAQARKLGEKLKVAIGLPETWKSMNLNKAKSILNGLLVSELEKLKNTELVSSLKNLKDVDWTVDQAQVILGKIETQIGLNRLTKDDIISMANTLNALASSDVGKFAQTILFAAFPELFVVKTIATPVLRQFIKVYKDQPGNKDISLLGGFAQALTRLELNEAAVKDIVGALEKLTGNDWDEAQIAELMVKVRAKLGDLNLTETIDSDSPPWGASNLKKLGKVILGFTKNELKTFPIRGIEDSVEVMGKQSGWRRGQLVSFVIRFREYMAMQNKSVENLGELDIETLGSLVQGFATKELKKLPKSVLSVAVQKIGEQTGLPEDKLKSYSFMAVEHFKATTGVDVLDTDQVKSLGNLIVGVSKEALSKLSKNAFLSEVHKIAIKPGMTNDKFKELIKLGKKYYGKSDVGQWLSDQWKKLGPAIKGMDAAEIMRINKDAFNGMIDYFGEMDGWSTDQAKALILKAKEFWNERDVSKWNGAQLRKLGTLIKGLSRDEILKITKNGFRDMIGSCSHSSPLDGDALKALATRAKQVLANGDAKQLNITGIKLIGCALTGLDLNDLRSLNLNIDIISELGKYASWSPDQLKVLADKVRQFMQKNVNNENLMSIGNLTKGLTIDDVKKIASEAFKYAAGKIGKLEGLSDLQIKEFIKKAKVAWGNDVATWTVAQLNEAGNLLSGLLPEDIPKIKIEAIDKIKISALKRMSKEQIKAFTVDQFKSMDSPQVYVLTKEQKSGLSKGQVAALSSVEQNDPVEPDPWQCTGTCSGSRNIAASSLLALLLSLFGTFVWKLW